MEVERRSRDGRWRLLVAVGRRWSSSSGRVSARGGSRRCDPEMFRTTDEEYGYVGRRFVDQSDVVDAFGGDAQRSVRLEAA